MQYTSEIGLERFAEFLELVPSKKPRFPVRYREGGTNTFPLGNCRFVFRSKCFLILVVFALRAEIHNFITGTISDYDCFSP